MTKKVTKTSIPRNYEHGSIVLVVAFFMTALLMMLALVIESGYLFSTKRSIQNCVDAAAMAGALHLCDGDPEASARRVLTQNLFPGKTAVEDPVSGDDFPKNYEVEITRGYYDENDAYDDFLVYKEFAGEGEPDFPAEEYVNAVNVSLTVRESLLLGDIGETKNVDVHVASVAFRRRFGILSYGEAHMSVIRTTHTWRRDQLVLKNMGGIHANGDIKFIEPVEVTGDTLVTAGGRIVNCRIGLQNAPPVLDVRPIDWEYMRANATVYTVDQWPKTDEHKFPCENEVPADYGNTLYRKGKDDPGFTPQYVFGLHPGDHHGRVYYFSNANAPDNATLFLNRICSEQHYNAYNFTIASEINIDFHNGELSEIYLGGKGKKAVSIFCKKDMGRFAPAADTGQLPPNTLKGVSFRTEQNFYARIVGHDNPFDPNPELSNYVNILAEGSIYFTSTLQPHSRKTYILNGTFGPPCGAALLMHGRLEMSDDKSK